MHVLILILVPNTWTLSIMGNGKAPKTKCTLFFFNLVYYVFEIPKIENSQNETWKVFLCTCIKGSRAYCFTVVCLSVRPSVHLSVCTNLTWKLNIFPLLLNWFSYKAHIWLKAHLIDKHLLVPRSRSSAQVKVKYQGHISQKMGVSGALVFHKHILFLSIFSGRDSNEGCDMSRYCYSAEYVSDVG